MRCCDAPSKWYGVGVWAAVVMSGSFPPYVGPMPVHTGCCATALPQLTPPWAAKCECMLAWWLCLLAAAKKADVVMRLELVLHRLRGICGFSVLLGWGLSICVCACWPQPVQGLFAEPY